MFALSFSTIAGVVLAYFLVISPITKKLGILEGIRGWLAIVGHTIMNRSVSTAVEWESEDKADYVQAMNQMKAMDMLDMDIVSDYKQRNHIEEKKLPVKQ